MRAVRVRGRHFNGRQTSGLNFDCGMSRLREGGGASVRDKNTLAGLCAKIVGRAYAQEGAYLRDKMVHKPVKFGIPDWLETMWMN